MDQWMEKVFSYLSGPTGGLMAMSMAFGAGLYHRFILPARIKPLEDRIAQLEEKSIKYDELMQGLAETKLSELDI